MNLGLRWKRAHLSPNAIAYLSNFKLVFPSPSMVRGKRKRVNLGGISTMLCQGRKKIARDTRSDIEMHQFDAMRPKVLKHAAQKHNRILHSQEGIGCLYCDTY
jgi:hypothetical protein